MTRGERLHHYRLVRELGAGGMGEVWEAFDEILQRRVAIKAIHANRRLDTKARARFLREARTLSALDHHHICRIYDFIEHDEMDLLVLELIEGIGLGSVIAAGVDRAHALELAEQVADALAIAHAAGVVHRDLKPANLMVTPAGQLKVLDFGLARPLEATGGGQPERGVEPARLAGEAPISSHAETMSGGDPELAERALPSALVAGETVELTRLGSRVGTLRYMSPEQARGEPATAASDMFSFGLVLQELLTGAPAYESELDAASLIERASRGETRAPEGLDANLADLVRRLQSLAPTLRPTAVEAQSRLRWIRDRPKRIVRRAITAGLLLLAGVAGLKYTLDLRRERGIAVAAREEADRRREQAEDLIQFMLGDLRKKLEPVGRLEILDDVGDHAMDYFAAVPPSQLSTAELFRRTQALNQIGDVRMAQGRLPEAMKSFRESVSLSEQLVEREPANPQWLAGLGAGHYWVGAVHWSQGDLDDAEERFQAYLDTAERLIALEPENLQWKIELAYAQQNLGAVLEARGQAEQAVAAFSRVAETFGAAVAAEPDHAQWSFELGNSLSWLGSALESRGNLPEAQKRFGESLEIFRKLAASDPSNTEWQQLEANAHNLFGRALEATGDDRTAATHFAEDLSISEKLARQDPDNAEWQRDLAVSRHRLARSLLLAGDVGAAVDQAVTSQGVLERLVDSDRTNGDWRRQLGLAINVLADCRLVMGEPERALAAARASGDAVRPLVESGEPEALPVGAAAAISEGQALSHLGRTTEARSAWRSALDLVGPAISSSEDRHLIDPWVRSLVLLGRPEEARAALDRLARQGYRRTDFVRFLEQHGLAGGGTQR